MSLPAFQFEESGDGKIDRRADPLDIVDYRLAETEEEKEAIYRLRYDAYLREGAIVPSAERTVTDRFDDLPNAWLFGVFLEGRLASSIRISVSSISDPDCPAYEAFRDRVEPELKQGKVLIDPTRFVAAPNEGRRFPELPYVTLRLGYIACAYFNADLLLAIVRPEHQAFYRRVFTHETISEPRLFPGLLKPVGLMAMDYPRNRDRVFARYPFMRSSYFERRALFERSSPKSITPVHPLTRIIQALREDLRDDPALGLCLKILDYMAGAELRELGTLSFSNLSEVVGKSQVDAELLRALTIMTTSKLALLEARGKFVDDDGAEYKIATDALSHVLFSGKFFHPRTGEAVSDFERKLMLYFLPSAQLEASLQVKKFKLDFAAQQ